MTFDERGNLLPYQVIETDIATIEQTFDSGFTESSTRHKLLANLIRLCELIRQQINSDFRVWIDGSFVTQKLNPNDVDAVFFINSTAFETHETALRQIANRQIRQEQGIDCYFVRVYPEDHPNYLVDTESDTKEWLSLFSRTRIHRNGKRYPKGIVQLLF